MRGRNSRLGKNHLDQGGCAFVSGLQTGITSREKALRYDGQASGAAVYAYVGGNPLSYTDPLGLQSVGSHYYSIWMPLCVGCTKADGLNAMRNFSAPGAPYAVDGTHDLMLWGRNPIHQTVDPCHYTITNQTLPGHFFGGQVSIAITEQNGVIGAQVTGSGIGPHSEDNQIFGPVIFEGLGNAAYFYLNPGMSGGSL